MTQMPAVGITRAEIGWVLGEWEEFGSVERVEGNEASWWVNFAFEGRPPVKMLINNDLNDMYLQVLVPIDGDHLLEALRALDRYGVAGLVAFDDSAFIRVGVMVHASNWHAMIDSCKVAALAYLDYREKISQGM